MSTSLERRSVIRAAIGGSFLLAAQAGARSSHAAAAPSPAAAAPAPPVAQTGTRFPVIARADMNAEQRRVSDVIGARRKPSASSTGGLTGPFRPLLYVPGGLDHIQLLGEYCRFETGIPAKLRELAIIIAARHLNAPLEFLVHAIEAREFKFAQDKIDAIAQKRKPQNLDADEELIYDFCTELYTTGNVSDAVFDRVDKRFGKSVIIDLVATCGYYATLGLVLNVSQITETPLTASMPLPFSVVAD